MEGQKQLELLNKELNLENEILREKLKEYRTKAKQNQKIMDDVINNIVSQHKEELDKIVTERNRIQEELDSILYSRSYKIIQKIKKIVKRG